MSGGRHRVVVTGIGLITPLGHSLEETARALERGDCAVAPASRFDASGFRQSNAAEVRGLEFRQYFSVPKAIKLTDRAARLGVAAARTALVASGYPATSDALENLGVVIGASGADPQAEDLARALGGDAADRAVTDIPEFAGRILGGLNPLWLLVNLPNMISAHAAIQLGAHGPNSTVMTDCAAGLQAIGEASEWIRHGDADSVLAGGADSGLHPFAYGIFEAAGLFESGDAGGLASQFVPGEGAAVFMLENRDRARARGSRILAEVCGYASAADLAGEGGSDHAALASTFRHTLDQAAWLPPDVQAIVVAYAPGRGQTDGMAVADVFGPGSAHLLRSDHTSRLGHALAAAGAIEAGLLVATTARGAAVLCSAVGYSGQMVTVAFRTGPEGGGA